MLGVRFSCMTRGRVDFPEELRFAIPDRYMNKLIRLAAVNMYICMKTVYFIQAVSRDFARVNLKNNKKPSLCYSVIIQTNLFE